MTTLPTTTPEITQEQVTALLPPYMVILYNDEVNAMNYVVQSLMLCVPPLSQQRAEEIMLEAHTHGQAVVIVCPLEMARPTATAWNQGVSPPLSRRRSFWLPLP